MDRVCISCREKRRECDGRTPCRPCSDADIVCTYTDAPVEVEVFQRPFKDEPEPTPPVLSQIPHHVSTPKHTSRGRPKVESPMPPSSGHPLPASVAASNLATPSTMRSAEKVFDIGIGFLKTLVQKTFENLSLQYPALLARAPHNIIEDLFNKPVSAPISDRELLPALPSYNQMRRLTRTAMDNIYPLSSIVPDPQYTNILEKIRSTADWSGSRQQPDDLLLLRIVVALGYLCSADVHLEEGCHHARTESTRHFLLVKSTIDEQDVNSPVRLQALLCMVLYLVATSKIAAAHAYMVRANTAIPELGAQTEGSSVTASSPPTPASSKALVKAALFLDTYICDLLGTPLILQPIFVEMTSIGEATNILADVAQLGRNQRRILEALASELHLELFGILSINRLSAAEASTSTVTSDQLRQGQATSVTNTYEAEKQLQWWLVRFENVFPQGEVNSQIAGLRHEIQMSYFQVGLVLYHSFLPYHAFVKREEEDALFDSMIAYGNTGLDLARRAISTSADFLRYHQVCPASWQTTYTLFLAVMSLLLALTANGGDEAGLGLLVKEGTLLLNVMSCAQQPGVLQHLTIIKSVADRFDPPIDIGAIPVTVRVTEPRPTIEQRGLFYSDMPDHPGAFRQQYQAATISSFCQRGQA